MACPPTSDRTFGPRVNQSCRPFDFTLQFEDVVFTCIPTALFLLLSLPEIFLLLKKPPNWFTALLGVLSAQLSFLALRLLHQRLKTSASLAGDVLSCIATVAASFISVASHRQSLRPSSLLAVYLSASSIFGIARLRTIWLLQSVRPETGAITAVFSFTVFSLFLESIEGKEIPLLEEHGKRTREMQSGLWARTCFTWLVTTFWLGHTKIIVLKDLPNLDAKLESSMLHKNLMSTWVKYDHGGRYALLGASLHSCLPSLLSTVIPRLCLTAFTFSQSFLINATVTYVSHGDGSSNASYGKGLIGAWMLVYLRMAVSNSIFQYQNLRFVTRLRGGLTALVYQRTLQTRAADMGDVTAVTLMGTDVGRIANGMSMLTEVGASLLDIAIGCWLLERQLWLACLAPVILILASIMVTSKVVASAGSTQRQWVEKVQERLKVTSAMLDNIKEDEIRTSRSFRKILVTTLILSLTPINLAPVVTLAAYVIISVYKTNLTLLTGQAFTSISLITLVTTPVIVFVQTLPMVLQCVGTYDRIQEFYKYSTDSGDEAHGEDYSQEYHRDADVKLYNINPVQNVIHGSIASLKSASFAWIKGGPPALMNINTTIEQCVITVLIGPAGSGKSAFLNMLLGEMATHPHSIDAPTMLQQYRTFLAYCAQEPWLENKTIRQNIIGPLPFDDQWYEAVSWSCGLNVDLDQMDHGDQTQVGSRGLALSGGQKHRIALARAIYSRANTILLDDVFSGSDAKLVTEVSSRLLGPDGLLRTSKTTVILATHNPIIMRLADAVIVFQEGMISEAGTLTDLRKQDGYFSKIAMPPFEKTKLPNVQTTDLVHRTTNNLPQAEHTVQQPAIDVDARRRNGDFSVYRYYLTASGLFAVSLHVTFMVIWIFCTEFPTVWIKWWSETNEKHANQNVGMYIAVYAMLGVVATVGACLAAWSGIVTIISNSASHMHSDLLQATLKFSQDLELIDMDLPTTMINYSSTAISCLTKVIIIAVFSKYLSIAVPFMAVILYFLQRFYLQTSRQLRLLGIEAKAPLYACFTESMTGSVTIRAFNWGSYYQHQTYKLIDESQRSEYMLSCVQYCLGFVLEILTTAIAVALIAITIILKDRFSAGSVGVSLVLVVGFSETLNRLIKTWTKLESSIGAVARVKRFLDQTESEDSGLLSLEPPLRWPTAGAITIRRLSAAYRQGATEVLENVSMAVEPGQHIAICGSSGSGKSSFILSLLRLIGIKDGEILIDGVDISEMACEHLRRSINVIPQEPFLLPGSLRLNIDPYADTSDDKIIKALERVGLWSQCKDQGGLDMELDPTAWSTGQRQVICFARAMVRNCMILVLDEAMSSVDSETEILMQDIIDSEFKHCTVISIMHRLRHVRSYDKVAILDNGSLFEFDNPSTLLAASARFAELYNSSTH
ncbi:P-loop containing nucleoside triphosphate hydrolase protein [Polychaeton citri CBS 116435]|uniref:P-loop containing nucleoside triphosphate hydrolase protein n=1 Tax=Polychaeton citri CBS 116435 TaxID=1314669 RepID=A0A9P4UTW7_9PEZI|nr:P-loop containing nucleoside triphosphate hydrolase protein [Polychaeton citri CBS 116435]